MELSEDSFLEGAETFYGCLEGYTESAVQFTSLRGRGSFLPSYLRLSCDSISKAGCVPTFCRREAVRHRHPHIGTARLCLVPCRLVLLTDVFCWPEFFKFGFSGFVSLLLLPQKPFFHPLVEKGDTKVVFQVEVSVVQ